MSIELAPTLALDSPSLEYTAALERQQSNAYRETELKAYEAPEHDRTKPAQIGDQFIDVVTNWGGEGKIPAFSTHDLQKVHTGVTEAIVVTHGELGNASDYFEGYLKSLGDSFSPTRTAVVALQYPREVDPVDDRTLRWGYNDWRGGEPALPPLPPIDSYQAEDAAWKRISIIFPDLMFARKRSNSEGAQKDDRYLAFSEAFDELEQQGVRGEGVIYNPGTVLYFDPVRPDPKYFGDMNGFERAKRRWIRIPEYSPANQWPFGMDNPPPYIKKYLSRHSLGSAATSYIRRTTLGYGINDNSMVASMLPVGEGPDAQGGSRSERVQFKFMYLLEMVRATHREDPNANLPQPSLVAIRDVGHSALQCFGSNPDSWSITFADGTEEVVVHDKYKYPIGEEPSGGFVPR